MDEIQKAADAIEKCLKTLPNGVFAVDLWEQTSMPRDLFDDAVQTLVRQKRVGIKNHKLVSAENVENVIQSGF